MIQSYLLVVCAQVEQQLIVESLEVQAQQVTNLQLCLILEHNETYIWGIKKRNCS